VAQKEVSHAIWKILCGLNLSSLVFDFWSSFRGVNCEIILRAADLRSDRV